MIKDHSGRYHWDGWSRAWTYGRGFHNGRTKIEGDLGADGHVEIWFDIQESMRNY